MFHLTVNLKHGRGRYYTVNPTLQHKAISYLERQVQLAVLVYDEIHVPA
jgi:hypothetical protein